MDGRAGRTGVFLGEMLTFFKVVRELLKKYLGIVKGLQGLLSCVFLTRQVDK